jgi:hypothetical protein
MHMSPFEHVLASTGGSLSLAVQAGADSLRWTQVTSLVMLGHDAVPCPAHLVYSRKELAL